MAFHEWCEHIDAGLMICIDVLGRSRRFVIFRGSSSLDEGLFSVHPQEPCAGRLFPGMTPVSNEIGT